MSTSDVEPSLREEVEQALALVCHDDNAHGIEGRDGPATLWVTIRCPGCGNGVSLPMCRPCLTYELTQETICAACLHPGDMRAFLDDWTPLGFAV